MNLLLFEFRAAGDHDVLYLDTVDIVRAHTAFARQRRAYAIGLVLAMTGAPLLLLTLVLLLRLSGHAEAGTSEITLTRFDRRMPEANLLFAGAGCIVLVFLADKTAARLMHMVTPEQFWAFGEKMITDVVIYLCMLPLLFSLTRAMKAGILWDNSFMKDALVEIFNFLFSKKEIELIECSYYEQNKNISVILDEIGMTKEASLRDRRINEQTHQKENFVIYSINKQEFKGMYSDKYTNNRFYGYLKRKI